MKRVLVSIDDRATFRADLIVQVCKKTPRSIELYYSGIVGVDQPFTFNFVNTEDADRIYNTIVDGMKKSLGNEQEEDKRNEQSN